MTRGAPALELRWCGVDEVPLLQELVDTYWRRGHVLARDEALLRWQYRIEGDDKRLSVLIARLDSRPVGFLGVIRTRFCWAGEEVRAGWLATWTVAPESRSTQAGLALVQRAIDSFDVVGCIGFNETAERIYRALGFEVRSPLPRYVRAVDPAALERLLGRGDAALTATAHAPAPAAAVALDWSDAAAERWERTWREQIAEGFVGSARDAAFLRWRYVEHPVYRYVVRFAEGATALVVHRIESVLDREERVVRFVEALGDPKAAAELVALALAEEPRAALADFACATEADVEAFVRCGFVAEEALPERPPDWFQPLACSPRGLALALRRAAGARPPHAHVYATRADGDQDRPS